MYIKCTSKDLKNNYLVLQVGYCEMYYLLYFESPVFYNAGSYGWNYDGYIITYCRGRRTVAISTGYRPIGRQVDYNILQRYEQEAKSIIEHRNMSTEEKRARISDLLNNCIIDLLEH